LAFQSFGIITVFSAVLFFGLFVFLAVPVLKNQIVEVKDKSIILYNYGKGFELDSEHLYEVIKRRKGLLSYRFKRGGYRFQISPCSYNNGELLQKIFAKYFDDTNLL